MIKSKEQKEILKYIREQRTSLDQIAELMYWNSTNQCEFGQKNNMALCRQIGIDPESKAATIITELIRLYGVVYGDNYEIKLKKEFTTK